MDDYAFMGNLSVQQWLGCRQYVCKNIQNVHEVKYSLSYLGVRQVFITVSVVLVGKYEVT